ncbi:hypothetical protein ACFLTE_07355 [Bacteroidota bacterium]
MIHRTNKKNGLVFIVFIFISLLYLHSVNIYGQYEISDSLVSERIQCIQNMLQQQKVNANLWWYGWLMGYSVATVGQGTAYFLSDDISLRQDMVLGASTTILGVVGQLIMPLNPGYKVEILTQIPELTPENRLEKLSKAEELLNEVALREKDGRTWQVHALCGAVNLTGGIITWIGFDRSIWAGVGYFAFNTAISEIQILTQPTRAIKDYQKYCEKYKSDNTPVSYKVKPTYYVSAYPGGITFKVMF